MATTPEEIQVWLERHAAVSARLLPLHERWLARHTLDPEAQATLDQEFHAHVKEFEQFKAMPREAWDILDASDPDA